MRVLIFFISIFLVLTNLKAGYNLKEKCIFTATATVRKQGSALDHSPLSELNIFGDKIVFEVSLKSGTSDYTNIFLYYRKTGETDYKRKKFYPKISPGIPSYTGRAVILPDEYDGAGIEYYIVALPYTNAIDEWKFKSQSSPQKISFVLKKSIHFTSWNTTLKLEDGNPDDGECKIESNGDITIEFSQITNLDSLPSNSLKNTKSKKPVIAYKIEHLYRNVNSFLDLSLLYMDIDQDGRVDNSNFSEKELAIYWYDGFTWRLVGGNINEEENLISSRVYNTGIYGIFPVTSRSLEECKPEEHIITLDNNGINDFLNFTGLIGNFEIRIFNIRGELIKVIKDLPYWDGRDDDGKLVPSGVYFYIVKKDGKEIKGTFIIAK